MNKGQAISRTPSSKRPFRVSEIFTLSTLILVLANLVPIIGALYYDWNLASVLLIYWGESAVIGLYNFCKIILIGGRSSVFKGIFFIVHFGAFMVIHFIFLYQVFISEMEPSSSVNLKQALILFTAIWPALAALFISHGFSFLQNFIGRKEYKNKTVSEQMMEPYQRIVFMHLVIIFGAALMMFTGDSKTVLLLAIVAKIVMDVIAHIRERRLATAE